MKRFLIIYICLSLIMCLGVTYIIAFAAPDGLESLAIAGDGIPGVPLWMPEAPEGDMTKVSDGVFVKVLDCPAGTYMNFKIAGNDAWDDNWNFGSATPLILGQKSDLERGGNSCNMYLTFDKAIRIKITVDVIPINDGGAATILVEELFSGSHGSTTQPTTQPTTTPSAPPVTDPQITLPPTPDLTEPNVTQPTTKPHIGQPAAPDVGKPQVTQPSTPPVTEPPTPPHTVPQVTEPITSSVPDVTPSDDPDVTEPTDPGDWEPSMGTEPNEETEPTIPGDSEPGPADPNAGQPATPNDGDSNKPESKPNALVNQPIQSMGVFLFGIIAVCLYLLFLLIRKNTFSGEVTPEGKVHRRAILSKKAVAQAVKENMPAPSDKLDQAVFDAIMQMEHPTKEP